MKLLFLSFLILGGLSASAGPGDVGSVGTFGLVPVTKQITATLAGSSQLIELQGETAELGVSKNGFPQIELTVNGLISTGTNQILEIVAIPAITGQTLGSDNILATTLKIDLAGLEKIGANTIRIFDGAQSLQGFARSFRTKIIIEMVPSFHESVIGKKLAGRSYELHFPTPTNSTSKEVVLVLTYDGQKVVLN